MNEYDFVPQIPDSDPEETKEWLDALDAVVDISGVNRAELIMAHLDRHAQRRNLNLPPTVSTPYINTIPPEKEPWFPGDHKLEKRIRRLVRWNAVAMVIRANREFDGIGGHLSTFASAAMMYEVGMNWFFRGKGNGQPGDAVYFQGHAAPGIYSTAFLEGRLNEAQLDNFRNETNPDGLGLSSYPHPRLMPEFWEYPTVSMGLGPLNSIYHARFLRYLQNRHVDDTSTSRVWCFLGDGETDEPETLGAISLAARENLDNLTWVVNCNLQRLDGPVRGNAKIVQELESVFRGAGWNVIKVIWGTPWDALLAADVDGVLVDKMDSTPDGDFQRYAVSDGAHIREHFFGPDPRLRKLVEHLSDQELEILPRGGHDYKKLFAAYTEAVNTTGKPTVILAKTVKGWTLGPTVESRNATHQIKKMTTEQIVDLAERFHLTDDLDMDAVNRGEIPYIRPAEDSPEMKYLRERRAALNGCVPSRAAATRRPLILPDNSVFDEFDAGSGEQAVSTTGVFVKNLRNMMRDSDFGDRVVPIVPDEARTFGMDGLFKEFNIYAHGGQKYKPVDNEMLISYVESQHGQILEEGITEAGSVASWIAAGTSYATRGVPMVPFFTFYSMFGFQRVGDLLWAAADARTRGFLIGATAGRTTLSGEGLQHADGHSPLLASTIPNCRVYDPSFAYELATIIKRGLHSMYPTDGSEPADDFYYLTVYNEPWMMPQRPTHVSDDDIMGGMYLWDPAEEANGDTVSILFSGPTHQAARDAKNILVAEHNLKVELWSVPGWKQLREQALADPKHALVTNLLAQGEGPVVAVTDYVRSVPDQISRFVPRNRSYTSLGTDGYGRSDDRHNLRKFFGITAEDIVRAALDMR